jgi:hypothetical protein
MLAFASGFHQKNPTWIPEFIKFRIREICKHCKRFFSLRILLCPAVTVTCEWYNNFISRRSIPGLDLLNEDARVGFYGKGIEWSSYLKISFHSDFAWLRSKSIIVKWNPIKFETIIIVKCSKWVDDCFHLHHKMKQLSSRTVSSSFINYE